jgi:hypothetical protein
MTTNETQHTHNWVPNKNMTRAFCACGEETTTRMQEQQPDALTRLEEAINQHGGARIRALTNALLSEARKEMEALQRKHEMLTKRLEVTQETCNNLSAKSAEALRMGQQQGRVELAQEILESNKAEHGRLPLPTWAFDALTYEVKE